MASAALLAIVAPAAAQDAPAPYQVPRATEYLEVADWPDLAGIWYPDWSKLFGERGAPAKLTPEAQAKYDQYLADTKANGPDQYMAANCIPPGMPGVFQQPYPIEITYSPGRVTIFTEAYEQAIRIYVDGRPLPDDPDPFFNGNSVGHWEGDDLVFESVGFNPITTIQPGIGHSDKLKIAGRFTRREHDALILELTLTDPEVLAEPFVTKVAFKPDTFPLREWVCAENNRLVSDGKNGANIDLQLEGEDDPFGSIDGE